MMIQYLKLQRVENSYLELTSTAFKNSSIMRSLSINIQFSLFLWLKDCDDKIWVKSDSKKRVHYKSAL